jgi:hypothetical protein
MSGSKAFTRTATWALLPWACGALLACAGALADTGFADTGDTAAPIDPPGRVARVNLLEGSGALQLAGTDTWVEDLLNRPLTGGDKLWIESGARAELHIGSAALRLGARTALQLIAIDDRSVRLRLTAGALSIRLRDLGDDDTFVVETPAGDVALLERGGYRLDVEDQAERAHLAVWSGRAQASGPSGMRTLESDEGVELRGGDDPAIELAAAGRTDGLDLWAEDRDRREDNSLSARHVSREVVGYEALDGYGDWVVDPQYGSVWVPQVVAADWAPYRYGYWSYIGPWGWTWIDDAPWGFAPCHYGRWVRVHHGWGWAPGPARERRPVFAPALVAWVGDPPDRLTDPRRTRRIGWVPLGYNEFYRPPFHASRDYLQAANQSNTHLGRRDLDRDLDGERDGDRRAAGRGQQPDRRYVHQSSPDAYTTVSRDTFVTARPVGRNRIAGDADELRRAPVSTGALDVQPGERSLGRRLPSDRPGPQPDRALFERPGVRQVERPTEQRPAEQRPMERPVMRPLERPMQRPVERPMERPMERPIERALPSPQVAPPAPFARAPETVERRPMPVVREDRPVFAPPQVRETRPAYSLPPPPPQQQLRMAPPPVQPAPQVRAAPPPAPTAHEERANPQPPRSGNERRPERDRN